jgi:hypothetical protein
MTTVDPTPPPGPDARIAFRTGILVAAVVGLTLLAVGYRLGVLEPLMAAYAAIALFPVYLVLVASVLSVWLGYDKDATDLRPVSRSR